MVDSSSMNLMGHRVASDSFLENLKFLDFPMENVEGGVYEEEEEEEDEEGVDWNAKLQSALGPIPVDFLSKCLNENIANGGSELKFNDSKTVTDEGRSELTKQPHHIEDTSTTNKFQRVQPLSPISVLDDNNSRMLTSHIPRRARTKRSRFLGNKTWTSFILERDVIKKKKKIPEKKTTTFTTTSSGALKRCSHCQVTQTPQWREGPMGPKTLCNACGVRYRSGRLFPEYRPMASPGFVPSLHSNSHRKVLEMRNKGNMNVNIGANGAPVPPRRRVKKTPPVFERENSPPPEFIPMSDYLLDCVLGSEVFNY